MAGENGDKIAFARDIGMLCGKIDQIDKRLANIEENVDDISELSNEIKNIEKNLNELKENVKSLETFRNRMVGATSVVSFIVSLLVSLIITLLGK